MNLKPIIMNEWTESMHLFSKEVNQLEWANTNHKWTNCPNDIGYYIDQGEFDNNPFVTFFKIK